MLEPGGSENSLMLRRQMIYQWDRIWHGQVILLSTNLYFLGMGANAEKKEINPLCLIKIASQDQASPCINLCMCLWNNIFLWWGANELSSSAVMMSELYGLLNTITCFVSLHIYIYMCKYQNLILLLRSVSAGVFSFALRRRGQILIWYWEVLLHMRRDPMQHSILLWRKECPPNHTYSKELTL